MTSTAPAIGCPKSSAPLVTARTSLLWLAPTRLGGVMVAGSSQRYSQTWVSGSTLPLASNPAHGRGPGEAETPYGKSAGLGLALLL